MMTYFDELEKGKSLAFLKGFLLKCISTAMA